MTNTITNTNTTNTTTTKETTIMTTAINFTCIDTFNQAAKAYMNNAAPLYGSHLVKTFLKSCFDETLGATVYDSEESTLMALLATNAVNITKSVMLGVLKNDPWTLEQVEEQGKSMLATLIANNDWVVVGLEGMIDFIDSPAKTLIGFDGAACEICPENGWIVPSRAAYQWMYKLSAIKPTSTPPTPATRRSKAVSPRSKKEHANSFSYIKGGAVKANVKAKKALQFFESTPYLMDETMFEIIDAIASMNDYKDLVEIKSMQYVIDSCKDLVGMGMMYGEWYTDKRGRFYPMAFGGPNLQTSDLGRSLYSVVSTKPLSKEEFEVTGKKYFFQDMNDALDNGEKVTPKLIKFVVADPISYIIACLIGSIDKRLKAAKPFMFVKMCIEYAQAAAAWNKGEKYIFQTPVGLDAKSSGTQILALIAGCPVVADRCGITSVDRSTDAERKTNDPYFFAAKTVCSELAAAGLNFNMTRSMIKTPYMAIQYGGGFQAISKGDGFTRWVDELNVDARELGNLIIDSIKKSLGDRINDFISSVEYNVALKCKELGTNNFRYFTLDGFPVQTKDKEAYQTQTCFELVYHAGRTNRTVKFGNPETETTWTVSGEESINEFVRKFVVHFIQGTDAMLARTVAIKAQEAGIEGYASIHDCFRTSVADAGKLLAVIQDAYVELFSDNAIIRSLEQQIGKLTGYLDKDGTWVNYSVGAPIDNSLFTADTFYGFC